MIIFKQKEYAEYDAMRSLYVTLMKYSDNRKFEIINSSSLIPVLKGNSVVIERFVISTSIFGRDRYRMYLKIGARAKMPDEVRLPNRVYDKRLGEIKLNFNNGMFSPNPNQSNNGGGQAQQKNNSEITFKQAEYSNKKKNNGGGGNNGGAKPVVATEIHPFIDLTYKVQELIGEAIVYDKKSRTLVLEFTSIQDAISALNILPFGLNYKIYLLDS